MGPTWDCEQGPIANDSGILYQRGSLLIRMCSFEVNDEHDPPVTKSW